MSSCLTAMLTSRPPNPLPEPADAGNMMSQQELFAEKAGVAVKCCERCGRPCRVAECESTADYMRRGTATTGKYCANCLMTFFVKHFDMGPAATLGAEEVEKLFPDCLRMPHIQEQMNCIASFGDAPVGEVDWETVIANWALPFTDDGPKKRKKK